MILHRTPRAQVLALLLVMGPASLASAADPAVRFPPVSMIKLLATPENFAGKSISVSGFLSTGFEDFALYFSEADRKRGVSENALWLDTSLLAKDALELFEKSHKSHVRIIGTFDPNITGHFGMFPGGIKVQRVIVSDQAP